MISVDFKMFLDRPDVMKRINRYQRRVLAKAGGYARTAMRRTIRPPKSGKKSRTVLVDRISVLVPVRGKVVDARTQRPVATALAQKARLAMAAKYKSEGAGQPPRRGPSDLLRKHIYFGLTPDNETVVIGPMLFSSQPQGLQGARTVPELLNKGGSVVNRGMVSQYAPHPYVEGPAELAKRKLAELVASEPLV